MNDEVSAFCSSRLATTAFSGLMAMFCAAFSTRAIRPVSQVWMLLAVTSPISCR
ncbi:hypothetical protein PFLmoz3_04962 [Pseudomonas fluorescens]|uniref:Uncharacterized protein n=1 Tax=Pseudomonas fluorescens TaxID=294 RepID=A0A120G6B5_PSEFL|nr:hypothetical protein PFLmoz3_04962 [Pseudomonas fluorescens]